jgi:uncharacterized lipoprotein YajG
VYRSNFLLGERIIQILTPNQRNFMQLSKIIIPFCASIMLSACSTRVVDFTLISSKNIDLSHGADFKRSSTRVKGEDKRQIFFIIPTGVPNAKEAMDKAIESVPGAVALLDGVINKKAWSIPFIYGEVSYEVEGTPLIDPALLKTYK